MSDDQRFMSIRGYAKLRDASEGTIRYHIRAGAILLRNGKVDVAQADLAWARRRHQSRSNPGAQTAAARIRRARAKLALAQDEVTKLDDEYAESSTARAQYQAEAGYVIAQLKAMPALEAASVAQQLGITPEEAKRLLDQFIELCLSDLGDLRGRLAGVVDLV